MTPENRNPARSSPSDGEIMRDAEGHVVKVRTASGVRRVTMKSRNAIAEASARRSAALKRLANR